MHTPVFAECPLCDGSGRCDEQRCDACLVPVDAIPPEENPSRSVKTNDDNAALENAVRKMALVAEQLGLTPSDLIKLLDSGMSVAQLLAYILAKHSGSAVED